MAETLTLTSPIVKPTQAVVRIERVILDIESKSVTIQWLGNNNEAGSASYPTPVPQGSSQPSGATVLSALNTSNLTSNSLVKRIITRLQTDGYLAAGTVAGVPD